jgi:t-SNARE complex subunit (syntaxin)
MESTLIQEKKPSKEEVFESLEKDVLLLNSMFNDLHDIVKQQGHQIDTLEDSIVTTKSDVELAHKDIVSAKGFSSSFNSIRNSAIGVGLGSLVYLYNPYLAVGSIVLGGYLGYSIS